VTPLIVVILAVAWIAVLVPPLLRSRTDDRPSASVGSFRQQLATLSRTGPERRGVHRNLVAVPTRPIGRPGTGRYAAPRYEHEYDDADHRSGPPVYARGATNGYRPVRQGGRPVPAAGRPRAVGYSMRSNRADVRRRRQNVLVGLLASAAVTAVGGFALGVSPLVGLNLVIDAVLVFYLYLLIQLRRAEEERAMRTFWSKAA
jgi:hypothetical protein